MDAHGLRMCKNRRVASALARSDGTGPGRGPSEEKEVAMSKRGRKRKSRKKGAANHGKRPNA